VARKRNPRTDKQVRTAIADLLEQQADPRLRFVTITDVDVTPDHEVATVYYASLNPDVVRNDPRGPRGDKVASATDVADALVSVTPRIRGAVSRRAGLRTTPELRFIADPVQEQAQRVDDLLRRIEPVGDTETPVDLSLYKAPREEA